MAELIVDGEDALHLTVAELKSRLDDANVSYTKSVKKADLVKLYSQAILSGQIKVRSDIDDSLKDYSSGLDSENDTSNPEPAMKPAPKSKRSLRSKTPIKYADKLIDITVLETSNAGSPSWSDSSDVGEDDLDLIESGSDHSHPGPLEQNVPQSSKPEVIDSGEDTPGSDNSDQRQSDGSRMQSSGSAKSAGQNVATIPKPQSISLEDLTPTPGDLRLDESFLDSDPMDIEDGSPLEISESDLAEEIQNSSDENNDTHEASFVSAHETSDSIKKRSLDPQDSDLAPRKHSRLNDSPPAQVPCNEILPQSPPLVAQDSFVGIDILPPGSPHHSSQDRLLSDPAKLPIESRSGFSPTSFSSSGSAHHITPLRQRRAIVSPAPSPSAARVLLRDLTAKPRLVLSSKISAFSDDELSDEEDSKFETPAIADKSVRKSRNLLSILLHFVVNLFIIILVVTSTYFGLWYRQRQFDIGFCGQQQHFTPTFSDLDSPLLRMTGQYLDSHYLPDCVPCPAHARCFPNLRIGCYQDFVEHKPWSHFIKPYNAICVPDTLKAEKLEIMISVALDLLHHKNAQVDCGTLRDDQAAGISQNALHDMLLSMKAPYISDREFEDLWTKTCIELEREPAISELDAGGLGDGDVSLIDEQRPVTPENPLFRSTSLQNVDLRCTVRNGVTNAGWTYKYQILSLFVVLVTFYFGRKFHEALKLDQIKQDLVLREVLGKLYHQYQLALKDKSEHAYLGAMQLRDTILGNEHNITRRVLLWNKVAKKIEVNTNVAIKIVEIHGEVMKVWEWVGGS